MTDFSDDIYQEPYSAITLFKKVKGGITHSIHFHPEHLFLHYKDRFMECEELYQLEKQFYEFFKTLQLMKIEDYLQSHDSCYIDEEKHLEEIYYRYYDEDNKDTYENEYLSYCHNTLEVFNVETPDTSPEFNFFKTVCSSIKEFGKDWDRPVLFWKPATCKSARYFINSFIKMDRWKSASFTDHEMDMYNYIAETVRLYFYYKDQLQENVWEAVFNLPTELQLKIMYEFKGFKHEIVSLVIDRHLIGYVDRDDYMEDLYFTNYTFTDKSDFKKDYMYGDVIGYELKQRCALCIKGMGKNYLVNKKGERLLNSNDRQYDKLNKINLNETYENINYIDLEQYIVTSEIKNHEYYNQYSVYSNSVIGEPIDLLCNGFNRWDTRRRLLKNYYKYDLKDFQHFQMLGNYIEMRDLEDYFYTHINDIF